MKRVKQLSVSLPNKPGMLAKLCECLAAAKVNIQAISVADSAEAGLVRMVVSDARAAKKALGDEGIAVYERWVRLVELPNKVGALAEMARSLAKRKVNILYAYGTASPGRGKSLLVVDTQGR